MKQFKCVGIPETVQLSAVKLSVALSKSRAIKDTYYMLGSEQFHQFPKTEMIGCNVMFKYTDSCE